MPAAVNGPLLEATANAGMALRHMAPFMDGHLANQDHALSPELLDARYPKVNGG